MAKPRCFPCQGSSQSSHFPGFFFPIFPVFRCGNPLKDYRGTTPSGSCWNCSFFFPFHFPLTNISPPGALPNSILSHPNPTQIPFSLPFFPKGPPPNPATTPKNPLKPLNFAFPTPILRNSGFSRRSGGVGGGFAPLTPLLKGFFGASLPLLGRNFPFLPPIPPQIFPTGKQKRTYLGAPETSQKAAQKNQPRTQTSGFSPFFCVCVFF